MVQHRAVKFVKSRYKKTDSVTRSYADNDIALLVLKRFTNLKRMQEFQDRKRGEQGCSVLVVGASQLHHGIRREVMELVPAASRTARQDVLPSC